MGFIRGGWLTPLLFFCCAAALLFADPLFSGGLAFPAHTDAFRPWSDDLQPAERAAVMRRVNRTVTDKNFGFHPDNMVTRAALRRGRLPLWNPFQMAGFPHLGQSLYGIFYPLNLPLFLLGPEGWYGPLTALHYMLAGLFTFLFLRRAFEISRGPALAGGLTFMACTAMTARFHFYMTVYPMAWAPLMLYGVYRHLRGGSRLALPGLAATGALVILAGYQQVAVYLFYLCLAYALFLAARDRYTPRPGRGLASVLVVAGIALFVTATKIPPLGPYPAATFSLGALAASAAFLACGKGFFRWIGAVLPIALALLLSVLLSAVQLAPVLALFAHSTRRVLLPTQMTGLQCVPGGGLIGFLMPAFLTDPMSRFASSALDFAGAALTSRPEALNYLEYALYIGILPLALLACLRLRRVLDKTPLFFVSCALILLAMAFGVSFVIYPFWFVPGFQLDPRRTLPVFSFLAAILFARTLEELLRRRLPPRRPALLGGILLAVALSSAAGGAFLSSGIAVALRERAESKSELRTVVRTSGHDPAVLEENARQVRAALLHLALASALAGGALLRLAFRPGRLALAAVTAAVAVDLFPLSWHLNPSQPKEGFLRLHPAIQVMQPRSPDDHFRIFRYGETTADALRVPLPSNLTTHFGIEDGEGYIVQTLDRYFALVNALQPDPPVAQGGVWVLPLSRPEALRSPLLDLLGVRYILATRRVPPEAGMEAVYHHRGIYVYRNPRAFPRAFLVRKASFFPREHPLPNRPSAVLRAMVGPGRNLRREVFLEGAPIPIPGKDGPLPAARVVYPRPEEARVTFNGPCPGGFLVLTDAWYPGWKAEVDGRPAEVLPADTAFRAVAVPPGAREVTFFFDPPEVKLGLAVSGLALLLLIAWTWRSRQGR